VNDCDNRKRTGLWISFEGIEGTGKSTQIERLANRLGEAGHRVTVTFEPGGTELGQRLRTLLLQPADEPMDPLTEMLLYSADRVQHLKEVILPALDRGELVLCDRYLDATLAYQGYGRQLGVERILEIHSQPPLDRRPHYTILLDLDPGAAVERARRRNLGSGLDESEGRFERERLEFHRRVRRGYMRLAAAEPGRFRIVDAAGDADDVEKRVWIALRDILPAAASTP
jgi:dTMP kinase